MKKDAIIVIRGKGKARVATGSKGKGRRIGELPIEKIMLLMEMKTVGVYNLMVKL